MTKAIHDSTTSHNSLWNPPSSTGSSPLFTMTTFSTGLSPIVTPFLWKHTFFLSFLDLLYNLITTEDFAKDLESAQNKRRIYNMTSIKPWCRNSGNKKLTPLYRQFKFLQSENVCIFASIRLESTLKFMSLYHWKETSPCVLNFEIFIWKPIAIDYHQRHHGRNVTRLSTSPISCCKITAYSELDRQERIPWIINCSMTRWNFDPSYPNPFSPIINGVMDRKLTCAQRSKILSLQLLVISQHTTQGGGIQF